MAGHSLTRAVITSLCLVAGLLLTNNVQAQQAVTHIDPDSGVRFNIPFPLYQKKSALQVENLIKDTMTGELAQGISYGGALYADDSDDFIVIWRQAHKELPTRQEFRRLAVMAPLRSAGKMSDARVYEERAAATFVVDTPVSGGARQAAHVLMVLTKKENVFVGYYGQKGRGAEQIAAILSSLEVDPGRAVRFSELDRGLRPLWSGVIVAAAFLFGFLGYMLVSGGTALRRPLSTQKKSGGFSAPDSYIESK